MKQIKNLSLVDGVLILMGIMAWSLILFGWLLLSGVIFLL